MGRKRSRSWLRRGDLTRHRLLSEVNVPKIIRVTANTAIFAVGVPVFGTFTALEEPLGHLNARYGPFLVTGGPHRGLKRVDHYIEHHHGGADELYSGAGHKAQKRAKGRFEGGSGVFACKEQFGQKCPDQ